MKKKLISLLWGLATTLFLSGQNNVITYTATMKLVTTTDSYSSGLHPAAFNVAISQHTFSNGKGTITFVDDVTTIGLAAFYNCQNITSINLPNSVTTIGARAFSECYNMFSINIPNSVTTIGEKAFKECRELTSITIPSGVTKIDYGAFSYCEKLISIIIPNSVTAIGVGAFQSCYSLNYIISYAFTPPTCNSSCFREVDKTIPIYVPSQSISLYKSAKEWKDFTNILSYEAEIVPSTDEVITQPSANSVAITWPITDGTDTYTLTITKNGETVCVLTFNANGQLTNIAFAAPGHNGAHQAPVATLTAQGYQFTVTGLNPGTAYDYNVTATDAEGKTLAEHKGNFSTTGGGTGLNTLPYEGKDGKGSKYFHNSVLVIDRNGQHYSVMGERVR